VNHPVHRRGTYIILISNHNILNHNTQIECGWERKALAGNDDDDDDDGSQISLFAQYDDKI